MKSVFFAVVFLIAATAMAQPSADEVKKHRILRAERIIRSAEDTTRNFWIYDMLGRDSIQNAYSDTLSMAYKMKNGRLVEKIVTSPGREGSTRKDVYTYEYDTKGGYKETNKDGSFGMTSYVWFDKSGKKLRSQSPDGNTLTYTYGPNGKLMAVNSDGKNDGVKVKNRYHYNPKGLVKLAEYESDGNKSSTGSEYDAKGRLIKTISKGGWEGEDHESIALYEYNEKGLVSRIRISSKNAEGSQGSSVVEYKYEFRSAK